MHIQPREIEFSSKDNLNWEEQVTLQTIIFSILFTQAVNKHMIRAPATWVFICINIFCSILDILDTVWKVITN